jgi:hypothetical protein
MYHAFGRNENKICIKTLTRRKRRGTEREKIKMDLYERVWTRYNWLNAMSAASSSISH